MSSTSCLWVVLQPYRQMRTLIVDVSPKPRNTFIDSFFWWSVSMFSKFLTILVHGNNSMIKVREWSYGALPSALTFSIGIGHKSCIADLSNMHRISILGWIANSLIINSSCILLFIFLFFAIIMTDCTQTFNAVKLYAPHVCRWHSFPIAIRKVYVSNTSTHLAEKLVERRALFQLFFNFWRHFWFSWCYGDGC